MTCLLHEENAFGRLKLPYRLICRPSGHVMPFWHDGGGVVS